MKPNKNNKIPASDNKTAAPSRPSAGAELLEACLGWLLFFAALLFWEALLRIDTMGSFSLAPSGILFLAAAAFAAAALSLWRGKGLTRVLTLVLLCALYAYYAAQTIYFRIFGSLFSVSMIGMGGTAVQNFLWSMKGVLLSAAPRLALMLLPAAVYIAGSILFGKRHKGQRVWLRLPLLALMLAAWLLGAFLLPAGSRAYEAYHSSLTDTDSSGRLLGALPTTVIEACGGLLGADEPEALSYAPVTAAPPIPAKPVEADETPDADTAQQPPEEVVPDTSPHIREDIDLEAVLTEADDERVRELCRYFAEEPGTNRNEYTGLFEGYNLVYICAEAFSSAAVNPYITPTLYKLATSGIVLTNYYNSFPNTTTNGEFAMMTGLWPDVSRDADDGFMTGTFCQSVRNAMPYGLGNIFRSVGVNSYGFHGYHGYYYDRIDTHPNLGYKMRFNDTMALSCEWPSSDLELFRQTVDDFIGEDRFNVYYMTFSGHGSYDEYNLIAQQNIEEAYAAKPEDVSYSSQSMYYLAANKELDKALEYLLARLEEAGKLDNTLIVLAGDHYPYYLDNYAYYELAPERGSDFFGTYHSTCILYSASVEEPIVCDAPCCTVDILPTVLNLLGLDYDSRFISGRDVFSSATHVAMLYNRSWVTEYAAYHSWTENIEWYDAAADFTAADKQAYVSYMNELLRGRYLAALEIVDTDFYQVIFPSEE